ncbi:MAG: monooxygenase [Gammaproteobacteria bacterium]
MTTQSATANEPRDFTFIKPRKRRLTEYEAVTVHQQWEPGGFDVGTTFLRGPDGRSWWEAERTALKHPDWFVFRDPAQLWQRSYVRLQAEQERSIERITEDAVADGMFHEIASGWLTEILGKHYRAWSFFEYGLFRAFSPAQREALSDSLGNAICFQSFDHMRLAQAVVAHLLEIELNVEGFEDRGAKDLWTDDPIYQPSRHLVEDLIMTEDWAEQTLVVNLVVAPILSRIAWDTLVRKPAALHGDAVTPLILMTAERDRRRNLEYSKELVKMVTADDIDECESNRKVIAGWIDTWRPRVIDAARSLAPIAGRMSKADVDFDAELKAAVAAQAALTGELGLDGDN